MTDAIKITGIKKEKFKFCIVVNKSDKCRKNKRRSIIHNYKHKKKKCGVFYNIKNQIGM